MKKNFVIRLWVSSILLAACTVAGQSAFAQNQPKPTAAQASPVAAQLQNARAFEQRNRIDLAVPVWKQVLEADPKNTQALAGLARAAALRGDSTLATIYVNRLRAISPNDPNIARIQKMHANPAATAPSSPPLAWHGAPEDTGQRVLSPEEAAYQALHAKRTAAAEARFKAILAKQPHDASALAGMGYVRLQQGNFTGAISYLEQAKRARPKDQAVVDALESARFQFILSEGDKALAAGDLATAEKRYRSALELRGDNADALTGLGQVLVARNDPAGATPLFEQAIAAAPGSPAPWRGLVLAASRSRNPGTAVAADERMPDAVRTALHKDPTFLEALGSAQLLVGRGGDAQGSLETAVQLATDDATKRGAETQLAGVLLARSEPQRAEDLYKQVTASDASNVAAWQGLIESQHTLGHEDDALATIDAMPRQVRDQAMRQPGFSVAAARVYRAEKRLDIAQELLENAATQQASAGDATHTAVVLELASLDIESGHPQLAYPLYQQVLRQQPDRADAWAGLLTTLHLTGHDREAIEQAGLIPPATRV
ncbi:MAG TPA: tetratricopeptide repeat protein, partial [Acidobacteriaceae bacterium]|nr:tetratricopeptide repeat protein [Acidobacteriaceae bacterium]